MVRNAEQAAQTAEADKTNDPGMCLQQTRIWCDIPSKYPDATTAWKHTNNRHPGDRHPPRGSAVYWTGGSSGHGHIALSLGGGKVRSTDAGGSGHVATVDVGWPESHWGLPYAGWAWDINEVTIPHSEGDDDMPLNDDDLEKIAHRVNLVIGDYNAQGKPRDPKADQQDQGNARLKQIENVVRDIQDRVKKLEKK